MFVLLNQSSKFLDVELVTLVLPKELRVASRTANLAPRDANSKAYFIGYFREGLCNRLIS